MTWPTKDDFVDGDVLTAAQVNNIADNLNLFDPTSATSGQVPVADGAGSVAWGASGGMTELASGTFTAAVTISSIPGTYKDLVLVINNMSLTGNAPLTLDVTGATFYNKGILSDGTDTPRGYSYNAPGNAYWALLSYAAPGAAQSNGHYYVCFPNYALSTGNKFAWATYTYVNASSQTEGGLFVVRIVKTGAITDLVISGEGVTPDAGTYKLFGVS